MDHDRENTVVEGPHERATVVLVASNDVEHIGGAVTSLLALEGGPHVIQLVDDGSSDGTWERMNEAIGLARPHEHEVRTSRFVEPLGMQRLLHAIGDVETPCVCVARPEDRAHPDRLVRQLHALQTTGASVVVSNRTRLGGSIVEHAEGSRKQGSGEISARDIAFHIAGTPTNLGTICLRPEVLRRFTKLIGPRLSEDLGQVLAFRGALLGGCYYIDETLVDFKEVREGTALDMRSRETCREGLFSSLIASRVGMMQDLRDLRREFDGTDASLVHLEASLKGALLELVERWTEARDELWLRALRPAWVPEKQLLCHPGSTRGGRSRSILRKMRCLIPGSRKAA